MTKKGFFFGRSPVREHGVLYLTRAHQDLRHAIRADSKSSSTFRHGNAHFFLQRVSGQAQRDATSYILWGQAIANPSIL